MADDFQTPDDDWVTPPSTSAPPAAHDDWIAPAATPAAPQWTQHSPFAVKPAKTQEEHNAQIDALPEGSYYQTPDKRLFKKPVVAAPAEATDAETGLPIDYSYGGEEIKPPSATGAFLRGAAHEAIPAAAGVVGMGAGAALGAAAGAPLAPFTFGASVPVGSVIGGALGAFGASYGAGAAQEAAIEHLLPEDTKKAIQESEVADTGAHPWAQKFGRLLPNAAFFSPGRVGKTIGEEVAKRGLSAGLMGGQTAAQETVTGQPLDWQEIGESALIGAGFPKANPLADHLVGVGARPVNALTGRGTPPPPPGSTPLPGTPEGNMPSPGDVIGMPMGDGVQPMTVARHQGDITILTDAEGNEHPMLAADVARMRTEAPGAPVEPTPAVETPPTPTPEPATATPAETAPVADPYAGYGERTQADLDREAEAERHVATQLSDQADAAQRAAVATGAPPTGGEIAQRLAVDEADATAPPPVLTPTPPAQQATPASPAIPRGIDPIDAARAAIGKIDPGSPITIGKLRSELGIKDPAAWQQLVSQLETEGLISAPDARRRRTVRPNEVVAPTEPVSGGPAQPPPQPETPPQEVRAPEAPVSSPADPVVTAAEPPAQPERPAEAPQPEPEGQQPDPRPGTINHLMGDMAPQAAPPEGKAATAAPETQAPATSNPLHPHIIPEGTTVYRGAQEGNRDVSRDFPDGVYVSLDRPSAEQWGAVTDYSVVKEPRLLDLGADTPEVRAFLGEATGEPIESREDYLTASGDTFVQNLGVEQLRERGLDGYRLGHDAFLLGSLSDYAKPAQHAAAVETPRDPYAGHEIRSVVGGDRAPVRGERGPALERPDEPVAEPRSPAEGIRDSAGTIIPGTQDAPPWFLEQTSEGRRQLAVKAGYPLAEATRLSKMGWPALEREPEIIARMQDAWQRGQLPRDEPAAEASAESNAPKVIEGNHTKTGAPIVTVQLPDRVSKEDFNRLGSEAKRMGGYYSSFRGRGAIPGFIFKTREAADRFAEIVRGESQTPTRGTKHPEQVTEQVEQARADTDPSPTPAQVEAGNYRKGHVNVHGLPFVIETAAGGWREGPRDASGIPAWRAQMPHDVDYGYFRRSEASDGEHVDAYLGPDHDSQRAWVIDQVHAGTKDYDEAKVLIGFSDEAKARAAYEAAFSDGRGAERIGNVTPMSLDELKGWLKNGDTKSPIGQSALALPEPSRTTEPAHPQVGIADQIAGKLQRGERITARDLQDFGEDAYGSKLSEGKFTRADLYEALELGVNRYVVAHPDVFDPRADLPAARQIVRELSELKDNLPTQTVRSGEKDSMQQFSTPPDYAYTAAWAAKLGEHDRVLEPSAGTGSLVAPALNAKPREVIVNELAPRRAALVESLGPNRVFHENAEQLHNILPGDVKPTVVLMNPPFSAAGERMAGRRVINTGARHVEQALERLQPGGRLVAIVGRGMRMDNGPVRFREGTGAAFRAWWDRIGQQYDVRANIGVPGSVYGKYGTQFGTQLLVIDKNPPSGRAPVVADAADLSDLMQQLRGVRDDRQPSRESAAEPVAVESGREEAPPGSQSDAGRGEPVPGATPATGVREGTPDTGTGTELLARPGGGGEPVDRAEPPAHPGDALAAEQPERGGAVGAERQPETGVGDGHDLAGSGAEPDAMVLRPEGEPGSVLPASTARPIDEPGPAPERVLVEEAAANPEPSGPITESVYEPYQPQRIKVTGAKEHPTKLVQSAAMASVMPPTVDYAPRIPKALLSAGKLSNAQMEAVTYAGHAHSQMLPTEEGATEFRRGFFIGDGTGVGKGAQVAGIMLDNWNQGRQRAVWLSESRTLLNDARRDWGWLGRDPKEVFDFGKAAKPGTDVKATKGVAFLTYDTLKGYERQGKDEQGNTIKGQTRVDQMVNWLGKDFDGVIAFDESHNLANSMQVKGTRGIKDAAQKALAGIELQQKLPKARVVYVSATGATEVMNLAYAERLGLWGRGTAFPTKQEFISQISSGGVAAMELVARDMKALGHYISRNLSYDGVEYDRVEHTLSPEQREIYDELAGGWQLVLQNIEAALLETGPKGGGEPKADKQQRSNAMSAFWGAHQRFFNQIITSMQMPSVIRGIEADLKAKRQAVLQLVNTNEASQERAISKARAEEGDLDDLDMTPRDQLMQMIDKSFPTTQTETYIDENGNERTRPVLDSAGNPVHNPQALAMKAALLDKLGSIRVPDGPLEMLLNHFGTDDVAEITGRKQRVVRKPDEKGQIRSQVESRPGSANVTEADAFQGAKKRILVFSQAGMTGRSYHADLSSDSADARRSHYLVQAGWRADKAIQGFGRTHRTNQATAPIFHLVTTDLQGQRRFISSIARRLAQLGALTKGERRAGESGMFSAKDNLESNEATAALGALWRDIQGNRIPTIRPAEFEQQTGLKLRNENGESTDPPDIPRFLNRLLSLKYDMQNHVFGEFEDRLNTAVDRAAAQGTLDTGTETLKADRIGKQDDRIVHTDPLTGAETRYVKLNVENKTNPATFEQVASGARRTGGDRPSFYVRSKRSGKIIAVTEAGNVTEASTGRIVPQYRLSDPQRYDFTAREKIDGYDSQRYWERIEDTAQAKQLWDQQVAALPEYSSHDEHLITGAILPVWDRLGSWPRVYRLQTDSGERLLGRVIDDSEIDRVLKSLGVDESGRKYEPADVANKIIDGASATLANGWRLRRAMVADEPRIELIGPNYSNDAEMRASGVFSERIGYSTRYFIPTGDDAARVLGRVMERRPITELTGGERGLAENEPSGGGDTKFRNTLHELEADYPWHTMDPNEAARRYVDERGAATGNEYLVAYDARTGQVAHAGTSDRPNFVSFPDWGFSEAETMAVHHNHPSGNSLSPTDLDMLTRGVGQVVAHANGDVFSATLPPVVAQMPGLRLALAEGGRIAKQTADDMLAPLIQRGQMAPEAASYAFIDLVNRALAHSGLIDYVSTRDPGEFVGHDLARRVVAAAADRIATDLKMPLLKGAENGFHDRSAATLRPDAAMEGVSRTAEGLAGSARSDRAGGDQGRAISDREGRGLADDAPAEIPRGIDEDPFDLAGQAAHATVEQAVGPPGAPKGPGWTRRFLNVMGAGPRSPGRGEHWFNVANRYVTAPSNAARYDMGGVSAQKWAAEEGKRNATARLRDSYVQKLQTWLGATPAEARTLMAALELARLQGRDFPTDGRAIILQNAEARSDRAPLEHQPMAYHSRPGETVRLDSPRLIKMFGEIRTTMDKGWDDLTAATAKRYGWDGEPTSNAIRDAAAAADTPRERNRLEQTARMVGAIEYARRTAYVPFMRFGDYYFHVMPKEGTDGWEGEGHRPTSWFSLIDSRLPEEKVLGGRRDSSQTATAMRAEMERTFDPDQYEIREGYWHPTDDALREIGIPAIEKLFTLMGNDTEKLWRGRVKTAEVVPHPEGNGFAIRFPDGMGGFDYARAGARRNGDVLRWDSREAADVRSVAAEASELQERAIESLLNQVYEEMSAGFKKQARNVPGYSSDLTRSVGTYLNWLSGHIANIDHRDAIDSANMQVDRSYDPLARQFWHDWDGAQSREDTPLDGAMRTMRQATFYWALGLNASSTFKNLLDGPLIHMPVLTTGLGRQGRAFAAASYANAAASIFKTMHIGKHGLDVDPMRGARDASERALLSDADALGITKPTGMEEIAAIRRSGVDALTPQQRFNRRVLDIWGSNMAATDRLTRSAMLLSAYRTANRVGMDTINRVWGRDALWQHVEQKTPEAFAKFMVDRVAGIWGGANRIPAMRSPLGAAVGQFQSYSLNYLSIMHQLMTSMGPEGKASAGLMLGGLSLVGGTLALPFAQDAEKAAEWVYRAVTGIDSDFSASLLRAMEGMGFDKEVGEIALHGVSRQALGFDLGSVGMGDVLSEFGRKEGLDAFGPAASILLGAPVKAMQRHQQGQSAAAVAAELAPSPVKALVKGLVVYPDEGVRTLRGGTNAQVLTPGQIGTGERIAAAAGTLPTKLARAYEEREFERRAGEAAKRPSEALNKKVEGLLARAMYADNAGNRSEAAALRAEVDAAIRAAPVGARPNVQTINRALKQAIAPDVSAIRNAARTARPTIADSPYVRP